MGSIARVARLAVFAIVVGGCASITGIDAFSKGGCPEACGENADAGRPHDAAPQFDADAAPASPSEAGNAPGADVAQRGGPDRPGSDGGFLGDAGEARAGNDGAYGAACDAGGCPVSVATRYSCPAGGCNAPGGSCAASGLPCHCAADSQCASGRCVRVAGQNDVACSACSGVGAADGFGCLLASPGIPAAARTTFAYAPKNLDPTLYSPPATPTTIDCDATYDSSLHAFSAWCAGQAQPSITRNVAQLASGGPPVDVLAFGGLTLAAGHTLTVTSTGGGNPIIMVVYGSADLRGTIRADARNGASPAAMPGASGAGGDFGCGASTGTSQPATEDRCSGGGGGGGASAAGGGGAGGVGGSPVAGGAARASASLSPLVGGCPGGASGSWACRTSGGGGGGAIQISVAGNLTFGGLVSANGGNGGDSTCAMTGCGLTVYGGGGGGAGSGGAVLLESQSYTSAGGILSVNGGTGGAPGTGSGIGGGGQAGAGGAGGTASSNAGANGTGFSPLLCGPYTQCGGGGGGAYGRSVIRPIDATPCTTTLTPAPVLSATGAACLCVDDLNCPSGQCVRAAQCTGSCTGSGAADVAGCEIVSSVAGGWSCAVGNCSGVTSPAGKCTASGAACWCTTDAQCPTGRCADWAGCASGACTGTAPGPFHCAP